MIDIEIAAKIIANIIVKTDTDDRGLLLLEVSKLLKKKDQFFTAKTLVTAAKIYGYDESKT